MSPLISWELCTVIALKNHLETNKFFKSYLPNRFLCKIWIFAYSVFSKTENWDIFFLKIRFFSFVEFVVLNLRESRKSASIGKKPPYCIHTLIQNVGTFSPADLSLCHPTFHCGVSEGGAYEHYGALFKTFRSFRCPK